MFYLIATILLNTLLFIAFKLFERYKINTLQAIVFNYCTCVVTGSILLGRFPISAASIEQPWLPWGMLMGVMFISIFNLIGYCTVKYGITTTTIANKLSLVIPVLFSVFLYSETLGIGKIIGILIALPAVYLTTRVPGEGKKANSIWLPIILFISSGLLDTLVTYVENKYIADTATLVNYTIHVFATAATLGLTLLAVLSASGKIKLQWKNLLAGVLLGIPNYFSIYYLVKLLDSGIMQSSAAIPVNNIGILTASALAGILLFKESAGKRRVAGLILSIIAILLIAFGDMYGRTI